MDTFDPEVLRSIETLAFEPAKELCLSLIESSNTKQPKKSALIRDIQAAPNVKELSRIMWNVLLAGEGLITVGSVWQQTYGK